MTAGYTITKSARKSVLKRDKYTCRACGHFDPSGNGLTIDHMNPRSRGGTNNQWNLQVLCEPCNQLKGDRIMPEWIDLMESPEFEAHLAKLRTQRIG